MKIFKTQANFIHLDMYDKCHWSITKSFFNKLEKHAMDHKLNTTIKLENHLIYGEQYKLKGSPLITHEMMKCKDLVPGHKYNILIVATEWNFNDKSGIKLQIMTKDKVQEEKQKDDVDMNKCITEFLENDNSESDSE